MFGELLQTNEYNEKRAPNNGQPSKNAVQKAKKMALRNASQSQNGRGDKVTPRRSVISTPCALQASLQIFGRDMRTCVVAEQQPSRT